MSVTLVDSNVLIDVATRDDEWLKWSSERLAEVAELGSVAINQMIFAEIGAGFRDAKALDRALPESIFTRLDLPWRAAHLAGLRFRDYRRAGGLRERTLPDFLIGAHAEIGGFRLLTRDARVYRRWFPAVPLIAPDT